MKAMFVLVLVLGLSACNKPAPTVVESPEKVVVVAAKATPQASQPQPSAVVPTQPTVVPSPNVTVTKETPPKAAPKGPTQVGVKVVVAKKHMTKAQLKRDAEEKAAYFKAFKNKIIYVCLKNVVDAKIADDVAQGRIRDLGNVVERVNEAGEDTVLQWCIQSVMVTEADVAEFAGKF